MKIGFACGVFDLFHAGHVLMLKECREHCDFLIVAINSGVAFDSKINPGKTAPVYSLEERVLIMESSRYVDEVLVYSSESELLEILVSKRIDIRFLGEDYKGKEVTGAHLSKELHYTNRAHGLSSSLYNRIIKGDA